MTPQLDMVNDSEYNLGSKIKDITTQNIQGAVLIT